MHGTRSKEASEIVVDPVQGVGAILTNREGQVLLQLRDEKPALFPLHWTLPGGAVEGAESVEDAILREVQEELSLLPSMTLWKSYHHELRLQGAVLLVHQHIFRGEVDLPLSDIPVLEGKALGFFSLNEVVKLPIGFGFLPLLEEFFSTSSKVTGRERDGFGLPM